MPRFPSQGKLRTVYVVRHARTTGNESHLAQGWAPYELSEAGLSDLAIAKDWWLGRPTGWVIASPLRRTMQTAHELFGRVNEIDPGWVEVATLGVEGRYSPEVADDHPDLLLPNGWQRPGAPADSAFENMATTQDRAIASLRRAAHAPGSGHVVVVTHGGLLVSLLRADGQETESVPNLCVLEIAVSGAGWDVVAVHDPLNPDIHQPAPPARSSGICACCKKAAPLREDDPFEGRMDGYCDECAWRRCDVYPDACSYVDPLAGT